jgi:hypothetical protein
MSSIAWTFTSVADPDVYSESKIGIFSILDPGTGSATLASSESHSPNECLGGEVGGEVRISHTGNPFGVKQHLPDECLWSQVAGEVRLSHSGILSTTRKHLPGECVWYQVWGGVRLSHAGSLVAVRSTFLMSACETRKKVRSELSLLEGVVTSLTWWVCVRPGRRGDQNCPCWKELRHH